MSGIMEKMYGNQGGGSGGDSHNKGSFLTPEALREAYPTASAGDFAIVESTDTVWVWDNDGSDWKDGDQKGQVTSVNNQTGAVTLTASDVGALPSNTHIPADPVQADWDEADSTALDYIKNKPTLGTAASANTTDFATAAQGAKADSAIQSVKTINNQSIVGTGNVEIDGLPSQTGHSGHVLTTDGFVPGWVAPTTITFRTWEANE